MLLFFLQKSVESIVATLRVLMDAGVETILLLVTTTDVVPRKTPLQGIDHHSGFHLGLYPGGQNEG